MDNIKNVIEDDIEVEIYQEIGRMISVVYTTEEFKIEGL